MSSFINKAASLLDQKLMVGPHAEVMTVTTPPPTTSKGVCHLVSHQLMINRWLQQNRQFTKRSLIGAISTTNCSLRPGCGQRTLLLQLVVCLTLGVSFVRPNKLKWPTYLLHGSHRGLMINKHDYQPGKTPCFDLWSM